MADLEKWTAAAREAENNSVLVAVPAQSNEDEGAWADRLDVLSFGGDSVFELVFGAIVLAGVGLFSAVRQFRYRTNRLGNRGRNDRVAILFYDDRVDLHRRRRFGTKVGSLVESFPMTEVERPNPLNIRIAGMTWQHSKLPSKKLENALARHGVEIPGSVLS